MCYMCILILKGTSRVRKNEDNTLDDVLAQ